MKNFTLLLVSVLFAASSSVAQTRQHTRPDAGISLSKDALKQAVRVTDRESTRPAMRTAPMAMEKNAPVLNKTRRDEGIEDQPAGTLYDNIVLSYNGLYSSWVYGWVDSSTDSSPISIVDGDDGNVYIKKLCGNAYVDVDYWVKAERAGGDTIVINQQPIGYYYDYMDNKHFYEVARISYSYDDATEEETIEIAEDTSIKLLYKGNGIIEAIDEMSAAAGEIPPYIMGVVYWYEAEDEDDYPSGWYDNYEYYWNMKTSEMTETVTLLPEGAEVETYSMLYRNSSYGSLTSAKQNVSVAFVGDDVYLKTYTRCPGWIKGTLVGNKVILPNCQLLGEDSYYGGYQWMHAATVELIDESDEEGPYFYYQGTIVDQIELDIDTDSKMMTAPEGVAIYIDGERDRIYYAARYIEPIIYQTFVGEKAAIPGDPRITNFWDYDEYYESAEIDFSLNLSDTEGNYLNPDKTFYIIYVDDEVFEATPDDYEMLEEPISEFPYGFTDGDGWIGGTYYCLLFQPAVNVGIQEIYRGGGAENRSSTIMYDIATGETTVIPYNNDGVKSIDGTTASTESYYDISGRRVSAGARGFVMKTVTMPDGTSKTYKVVRK